MWRLLSICVQCTRREAKATLSKERHELKYSADKFLEFLRKSGFRVSSSEARMLQQDLQQAEPQKAVPTQPIAQGATPQPPKQKVCTSRLRRASPLPFSFEQPWTHHTVSLNALHHCAPHKTQRHTTAPHHPTPRQTVVEH